MADKTKKTTSYDVFKAELQTAFGMFDPTDDSWIKEVFNAGQAQLANGVASASIPDLLINDPSLTKYRQRFAGLIKLQELAKKQPVSYVPDISHYVASERALTETLKRYGLNNMANKSDIADIIGNDVSIVEAESRIVDGYMAIKNADSALTNELKKQFPNLSDADFVHALLTRKDQGADYLKKKVATAGIAAEATTAGIKSQIGAEELMKQGFTRAEAAKTFQSVAAQQEAIQSAAATFGEKVSQQDLQKQLEEEQFGIKTSGTVSKLRSQARAQFTGSSGIQTGSLSKKKQV